MGDGSSKGDANAARLASVASTAEALEELGYACAHAKDGLIEILGKLPKLDEVGLAKMVGMMARTHRVWRTRRGRVISWRSRSERGSRRRRRRLCV